MSAKFRKDPTPLSVSSHFMAIFGFLGSLPLCGPIGCIVSLSNNDWYGAPSICDAPMPQLLNCAYHHRFEGLIVVDMLFMNSTFFKSHISICTAHCTADLLFNYMCSHNSILCTWFINSMDYLCKVQDPCHMNCASPFKSTIDQFLSNTSSPLMFKFIVK